MKKITKTILALISSIIIFFTGYGASQALIYIKSQNLNNTVNFFLIHGLQCSTILLYALSIGFFVSGIITIFYDFPNFKQSFQDYLIDIISTNKFLNNFSLERLKEFNEKCNTIIYLNKIKKNVENDKTVKKFINLQSNIFEVLTKQYIESCKTIIKCKEERNYIEKEIRTHIIAKNLQESTIVYDDRFILYMSPINGIDKKDLRNIKEFKIKIDEKPEIDVFSKYEIKIEKVENDVMGYKLKTFLFNQIDKKHLEIEYHDKLEINYYEIRKVPKSDNNFGHRFKLPTLKYDLLYEFIKKSKKMHGSIFGTITKLEEYDKIITTITENGIHIICNCLMLPSNGISITVFPD